MEDSKMSLEVFLENFSVSESVKILSENTTIYIGTIQNVPFKILNHTQIKENSVYIDSGVIVIEVE